MPEFSTRQSAPRTSDGGGATGNALLPSLRTISGRQFSDLLLFVVTSAELIILCRLEPELTLVDWIYVAQHLVVLGIALTRPAPAAKDWSLPTCVAVAVSCGYPYAQVIYLNWANGYVLSPDASIVLVMASAGLSLASLLWLGRFFGLRPALRGLVTTGPYALVRHPMYLAYVVSDVGYNLDEWNLGTVLVVLAGWASLVWRIYAEERVLSQDPHWPAYANAVRYRLIPCIW